MQEQNMSPIKPRHRPSKRPACTWPTCCMLLILLSICLPYLVEAAIPSRLLRTDHRTSPEHQPTASPTQEQPDSDSGGPDGASSGTDAKEPAGSTGSSDADGEYPSTSQPPQDLEVIRLNDTSVVLKWYLPYLSYEQLQFFKIQYKSTRKGAEWKTDSREIPPTTKACQINNLRPGNYFFIVIAVYDNDDNAPSEQFKYRLKARSKLKPEEMPEQKAPVIFWSEAKSDYFRFKWTYTPKTHDEPYFGYLVYYRSTHVVSDFTIYSTLDENVEIAEVEPETPYEAKVVAYNQHGVSEFSDLIRIKTLPKSNVTTSTIAPPTATATTTLLPNILITSTSVTSTTVDSVATTKAPIIHLVSNHQEAGQNNSKSIFKTTSKPFTSVTTSQNQHTNSNSPSSSTTSAFHSLSSVIDLIFGPQTNDSNLAIRYTLLILLPLLCIVSATLCIISCHQRKKESPPSSPEESMQFDLEINSYFKNSFPGVEKDYPTIPAHSAHHGFVNNHPHINDFA